MTYILVAIAMYFYGRRSGKAVVHRWIAERPEEVERCIEINRRFQ
jgi:hypothetical protein